MNLASFLFLEGAGSPWWQKPPPCRLQLLGEEFLDTLPILKFVFVFCDRHHLQGLKSIEQDINPIT